MWMVLEKEKKRKAHQLRNLLYLCCSTFSFSLVSPAISSWCSHLYLCSSSLSLQTQFNINLFNLVVFFYGQSDWNSWSLIQLLPSSSMATQTASSSSYFPKYDVFLSFLRCWHPQEFYRPSLRCFGTKRYFNLQRRWETWAGKAYFSRALKSNRRVQICNRRSLKKLRFFKVVLDWTSKDRWMHEREEVDSFASLLPCGSVWCTEL